MSTPDNILKISADELDSQVKQLIAARQSFEVWGVNIDNMPQVTETLETTIEGAHLTCRIYSKGRWMAAAAGLFYPPAAIAILAGMVIHNAATYDPNYEICRDWANNKFTVLNKK